MEPTEYDPTGEASVWEAAARMVLGLKREPMPGDDADYWNTALDQAARALETYGREIKQGNGMYYRPLTGSDG